MRLAAIALASLRVAAGMPARATGLRCNHDLVAVGDSAAQLLSSCGEPTLRRVVALEDAPTGEGRVELWTYSFGPGTFVQVVTIEGGRIAAVEVGELQ